ncbi:MAG TPA: universal stress protein [Chryseosolibacter sp.]|nr:universal stress protein [Chryseosolibacter sp.]
MKRILVPCDFSLPARQAYKFAVDIAAKSGGEVLVMNTIAIPVLFETTFGVQPYPLDLLQSQKLEANAREAFERMKSEYNVDGARVSFHLVHDYLLSGIRDFIENKQVDHVVMGTSGSSGIEEFFIGSNTEKIVRFSKVPVIAVPAAAKIPTTVRRIVFPNTLELDQNRLIEAVKGLQKFFNASLEILYINTPSKFKVDKEAYALVEAFAKTYQLDNFTVNVRNSPDEKTGILHFAQEGNCDLLAMATHGRQGLAHLFVGSIAESVVNKVDCPIWTFNLQYQ